MPKHLHAYTAQILSGAHYWPSCSSASLNLIYIQTHTHTLTLTLFLSLSLSTEYVQTGPYNRAYTESQLEAGGGFILPDFNEEQVNFWHGRTQSFPAAVVECLTNCSVPVHLTNRSHSPPLTWFKNFSMTFPQSMNTEFSWSPSLVVLKFSLSSQGRNHVASIDAKFACRCIALFM